MPVKIRRWAFPSFGAWSPDSICTAGHPSAPPPLHCPPTRLQDILLGGKPLVAIILFTCQQLEVVDLLDERVLAAGGTGQGVAEVRMGHEL